jgi:hypothetical protein|tara:strand:+ start:112 stop:723 length:612 start_codon:yes stop_codon:yes gene_type:complete
MSGSDVQSTFIAVQLASDDNGFSVAATLSGAGNLTLGGALADGGAVVLDAARNVIITSAGDDRGDTFTITGTDESGTAQTEAITGANAGIATGTKYFLTISQIACSGATTGDVEAGTGTAVAASIFDGSLRLRNFYFVNTATAGTISFNEGSATGSTRMQFNTIAGANTNAYPDVGGEGLRFNGGAYVVYTQGTLSSLTAFYS